VRQLTEPAHSDRIKLPYIEERSAQVGEVPPSLKDYP
jgi:hypothetical protein